MRRFFALTWLMTFVVAGCSDTELLDVASTVGTSNAVGETATVYARVARSARSCWFKRGGPIKKTHMFYAEASPQAEGGRAEISIRKRRKDGKPGEKAFIVSLVPSGGNTLYSTRNVSLEEKLSNRLMGDVKRWA